MENDVVVLANGVRLERWNEDVFFVDVEGVGHRTLRRDDEVVLFAALSRVFSQAKSAVSP